MVDVGMVGVPYDGGATNRPGARYGPREVRSQSASHIRRVNQATGINPFELGLAVADV
jgi:guanidinopropionase